MQPPRAILLLALVAASCTSDLAKEQEWDAGRDAMPTNDVGMSDATGSDLAGSVDAAASVDSADMPEAGDAGEVDDAGDSGEASQIPGDDLYIVLRWTNPEDPDETDEDGADVDLHLLKMGPGIWFESPYDIYFRNAGNPTVSDPIWGEEDPYLSIDDRDGQGPEVIRMPTGGNCQWYAIGVHYYTQRYGTAEVSVRVYSGGELIYDRLGEPLTGGGQFLDLARVHWPSATVLEVADLVDDPPVDVAPEVTQDMKDSGLCTDEMLYP
ncbi:MAG: hypothetical protein R3324_02470 [Halobacteriales archaeon]|nr:hypothetical protein [Halobacteriales archaeon]